MTHDLSPETRAAYAIADEWEQAVIELVEHPVMPRRLTSTEDRPDPHLLKCARQSQPGR